MWNYIKSLWKPKPCEHYFSPSSLHYTFFVDEVGQVFTTQHKFCLICHDWSEFVYPLNTVNICDNSGRKQVMTNLRLVPDLEKAMTVDVVRVRIETTEGSYFVSSVDEDDDDLTDNISIIDPDGTHFYFPKSAVKALTAAIDLLGKEAAVAR